MSGEGSREFSRSGFRRSYHQLVIERYPEIEPYQTGMLDVGSGNLIYWGACGNPAGKPALVVHGGPGSGCRT
jgi:proline iminopeptidase